jgi:hypothetical protein
VCVFGGGGGGRRACRLTTSCCAWQGGGTRLSVAAGRHVVPCPSPPQPSTPPRRYLPTRGVNRARAALRLVLQSLSPHFCVAQGMHKVGKGAGMRCWGVGCRGCWL